MIFAGATSPSPVTPASPPGRADQQRIARPKRFLRPGTAGNIALVPNILQKPVGSNLVPCRGFAGQLINTAGNSEKLCALQISPLRICDLVGRCATLLLAIKNICEGEHAIRQRNSVSALAVPSVAELPGRGPGLPSDVFIVDRKTGYANRRRRGAKTQINIDPVERCLVGNAAATDVDDVLTFFKTRTVHYRHS